MPSFSQFEVSYLQVLQQFFDQGDFFFSFSGDETRNKDDVNKRDAMLCHTEIMCLFYCSRVMALNYVISAAP